MPVFASSDELNDVMERLWESIKSDPGMSGQLLKSKMCVRFYYREPEGRLTVDCTDGQEMKITTGESDLKPDVEMFMKSDVAHDFWLGKVNVPVAILSGKIVSKGPVNKALSLLPVVKPAYTMYPEIFESAKRKKAG
jgi:putative sterol carrier protein